MIGHSVWTKNVWSQSMSILPRWKGLEISGSGEGSQRPKTLWKCMKLNWKFQRGGGEVMGDVWINTNTIQTRKEYIGK